MADQAPIPRQFFSEYTELPFARCVDCDCSLLTGETVYSVIKHVVGQEVVFEMAICMACAARMREQYSEETSENIQSYIENKLQERLYKSLEEMELDTESEQQEFTVEDGVAACAFCEKPRSDCHRYEMVGLFQENEIILESGNGINFSSPMMLCQDCNSEVAKLISKKTRDLWDRFIEEHFDGPPGIEIDGPQLEPILF